MLNIEDPLRPSMVDRRLDELVRRLGADEGATAYLEELRWPDGIGCLRCSSHRLGFLTTRLKHVCRDCGYQFRVTAGTALHHSHVRAYKWLLAVQLMLGSADGFPANRLHGVIGGSYKTSWFVEHRVRAALVQALFDDDGTAKFANASSFDGMEQTGNDLGSEHPIVPTPAAVAGGLPLSKQVALSAYRRPSADHLAAYWAETRWRLEQRGSTEDIYRATVRALLAASPVPHGQLSRPQPAAWRRHRGARPI